MRRASRAGSPLGRGHHLATGSVEQGAAQLLLQAAHLLAQGGLGEVDTLGGAGKAAGFDDGDEALQQLGVQQGALHGQSPFIKPLEVILSFNFQMMRRPSRLLSSPFLPGYDHATPSQSGARLLNSLTAASAPSHQEWLEQALHLAPDPSPARGRPFAALLVRENRLVASAVNRMLEAGTPPVTGAGSAAGRESPGAAGRGHRLCQRAPLPHVPVGPGDERHPGGLLRL